MPLSIVDIFSKPYELWEERDPTLEEIQGGASPLEKIKVRKIKTITDHIKAAKHIAQVGLDNSLQHFVSEALEKNVAYKSWKKAMPAKTPSSIQKYKTSYPACDFSAVDRDIQQYGTILPKGQVLFHGGGWWSDKVSKILKKPLSLTFCPQIAMTEAQSSGKAYDVEYIELFVLTFHNCNTKSFVFSRGKLEHEYEVLLGAGALLTRLQSSLVNENLTVFKADPQCIGRFLKKQVPVYVSQVDVSDQSPLF